jgi:hypothetical protein
VGEDPVVAVDAVLSCNAELALTLDLFEAEYAKTDSANRRDDCKTLATLPNFKTCLDSFTTNLLVNQDNDELKEYVTCYKACFTNSDSIELAKICADGAADSTCETEKAACSAVIF